MVIIECVSLAAYAKLDEFTKFDTVLDTVLLDSPKFFHQCSKIPFRQSFFTAKVSYYTVLILYAYG